MRRDSIALRLVLSSTLWIVATLAASGVLLVGLFQGHIERRFEHQLADHMEELVAAAEIGPDGAPILTWRPADPRFNRPLSGWAWTIQDDPRGAPLLQSESARGWTLRVPAADPLPPVRSVEAQGPDGRVLLVFERVIGLPRAPGPLLFRIAGPTSDIASDVWRFSGNTALVLGVLALFLIGLVGLQVTYGLRPLVRLREALGAIRAGRASHLPENFPAEVRPLARELNALMDYNHGLLDRARTQVGNLAHALKTPLAVLRNEAKHLDGDSGAVIRAHIAQASDDVERYLRKARIAGAANLLGVRADPVRVAADLKFTLEILHRERGLRIDLAVPPGLAVRVETEDLEEMLGNLMENASKWTNNKVRVAGRAAPRGRVVLTVEDDGPGIPADSRRAVLERGVRLDTRRGGTGLGLGIAHDIAALYGGALDLGGSPLGGLLAQLDLPAADS